MKRFLKLLFLLLAFVLLLGMMSCAMQPQDDMNPSELPSTGEQGGTDTIDRTDPSAGTYKIQFKLGANTVIHYYNAGETIIPPKLSPPMKPADSTTSSMAGTVSNLLSQTATQPTSQITAKSSNTIPLPS